jgi:hypothetical protein
MIRMNDNHSGLGLGSVLLIVFVVLKLCKLITWSWVWVLSPIWIGWVLAIIYALILKLK